MDIVVALSITRVVCTQSFKPAFCREILFVLASMPAPLDYREATPSLKKDGKVIDWVRIVGVLVEDVLVCSQRIGIGAVTPNMLPDVLLFEIDGYREEREVITYAQDRVVAATSSEASDPT